MNASRIKIPLHEFRFVLIVTTVAVILASLVTQGIRFATGNESLYGIIPLFDLDRENNIPAFYSASLLLIAALVIGTISSLKRSQGDAYRRHWRVLGYGFLYLAFDEAASIHELLVRPMRELMGEWATGIFYFAWVVPAVCIVPLVGLAFIPFWRHLPRVTRAALGYSCMIYLTGALGFELLGGFYRELIVAPDLQYAVITTIEESLELAGVCICILTMLDYLRSQASKLEVILAGGESQAVSGIRTNTRATESESTPPVQST